MVCPLKDSGSAFYGTGLPLPGGTFFPYAYFTRGVVSSVLRRSLRRLAGVFDSGSHLFYGHGPLLRTFFRFRRLLFIRVVHIMFTRVGSFVKGKASRSLPLRFLVHILHHSRTSTSVHYRSPGKQRHLIQLRFAKCSLVLSLVSSLLMSNVHSVQFGSSCRSRISSFITDS